MRMQNGYEPYSNVVYQPYPHVVEVAHVPPMRKNDRGSCVLDFGSVEPLTEAVEYKPKTMPLTIVGDTGGINHCVRYITQVPHDEAVVFQVRHRGHLIPQEQELGIYGAGIPGITNSCWNCFGSFGGHAVPRGGQARGLELEVECETTKEVGHFQRWLILWCSSSKGNKQKQLSAKAFAKQGKKGKQGAQTHYQISNTLTQSRWSHEETNVYPLCVRLLCSVINSEDHKAITLNVDSAPFYPQVCLVQLHSHRL
jgi:hypothetical protein